MQEQDTNTSQRVNLRVVPPPATSGKKKKKPTSRRGKVTPGLSANPFEERKYIEGHLDLNRYLIKHPVATFYVRVSGDSMTGAGIQSGSILVVDRAVEADDGDIIIARIGDELCVKRLRRYKGRLWLHSENEKYQPIEIIKGMDFEIWGRVMHSIRSY
jgi:DNA polymerase V